MCSATAFPVGQQQFFLSLLLEMFFGFVDCMCGMVGFIVLFCFVHGFLWVWFIFLFSFC